jgi:hypothetical protein
MKRILFSLAVAFGLSSFGTEAQACHRGYVYYGGYHGGYCAPVHYGPVFHAPIVNHCGPVVTNFAPVVHNQVFFNDCVQPIQPIQWTQPLNVCYPNTVWYGGGYHHCGWGGNVIWR